MLFSEQGTCMLLFADDAPSPDSLFFNNVSISSINITVGASLRARLKYSHLTKGTGRGRGREKNKSR